MERILLGLSEYCIKKFSYGKNNTFEVDCILEQSCPECGSKKLRIKDTFIRQIKSIPCRSISSLIQVKCHKYCCLKCKKYFNTRLPGVKKWGKSTEFLKQHIYINYNKGISNKDLASDAGIGVATVERFYHQMVLKKNSQMVTKKCPVILGIDEHRFTKKKGFSTTFCDLKNKSIFDIALGKDSQSLHDFLMKLEERERVRIVCIDMNSGYRSLIKQYFPNALIVSDRFHVVSLVNRHFLRVAKEIDEEHLSYGRGGLARLLTTNKINLTSKQKTRLEEYLEKQPAIRVLYEYCQGITKLLRTKNQNKKNCKEAIIKLLEIIKELKSNAFKPMKTLGKTLESWQEEVARMFRISYNNGRTEGFHRKMKLIQRRAYGFRNFENYRLRVKALCG